MMRSWLYVFALVMLFLTTTVLHRSQKARHEFMVASGYPKGRPGYVVDHVVPLCAGGADAPSNMQWMDRQSAKAKDRLERAYCRCLKTQNRVSCRLGDQR